MPVPDHETSSCLILDAKTVLTGSMNLTHNGLENNKEHLYRLTEPAFVAEVLADFEEEWLTAQRVTDNEIREMLEMSHKRQEKKREKSMTRPTFNPRRSLSFSPEESLRIENVGRTRAAEGSIGRGLPTAEMQPYPNVKR